MTYQKYSFIIFPVEIFWLEAAAQITMGSLKIGENKGASFSSPTATGAKMRVYIYFYTLYIFFERIVLIGGKKMKNFKKILSISLALVMVMAVFGINVNAASLRKLDLAFVIDTTGSMSDDISAVKENMTTILNNLNKSGMDYKVAVVDYRDYASRTGASYDYPYSVQCNLTSDYDEIITTINELSLGHGGDGEETVFSALIDGLNELNWRSSAGKCAILMGDAPALDPEPETGYTMEDAIEALKTGEVSYKEYIEGRTSKDSLMSSASSSSSSRSAITLFGIATSNYSATKECFETLSSATGGSTYTITDSEDICDAILTIIDTIPDTVDSPELSFFDKIKVFFLNLFYMFTLQFDKVNWDF